MHFFVVPGDPEPIYRQLFRQVVQGVAGGRLKPGERLPSHRELARRLVIAPLTVKKAYDELERAGHVRSERGRGTFVSAEAAGLESGESLERLREGARRLAGEAWLLGVDIEDLLALLREEAERLRSERAEHAGAGERRRT